MGAREFVKEMRSRAVRRRLQRITDSSRIEDESERELVEGRFDDFKIDAYSASGDGVGGPGLPETTPKEVYGEFEHDQAKPPDPAP